MLKEDLILGITYGVRGENLRSVNIACFITLDELVCVNEQYTFDIPSVDRNEIKDNIRNKAMWVSFLWVSGGKTDPAVSNTLWLSLLKVRRY